MARRWVMIKNWRRTIVVLVFATLFLAGCGWPEYLRLSQQDAPEKWGRVAVFPADGVAKEQARTAVEGMLVDLLTPRVAPGEVVRAGVVREKLKDKQTRQLVDEYTEKLYILNFSHPELSQKIGVALEVDTFVLARIEHWDFSRDRKGKNEGKIGIGLIAVDAASGRVLWRGIRYETRDYRIFKPELVDIARRLLRGMVAEFPI